MKPTLKTIVCLPVFLFFILFAAAVLPFSASADTGPKPSVRINFENMSDELCYGTLLSEKQSTGPHSVWDGNEEDIRNYGDLDLEIWRAFAKYEDTDGFYFLQIGWQVNETKEIAWTYYPPYTFKILLYFPQTDRFAVSGICERYAFDTYYTVDMDGVNIGSVVFDEENSTDERQNANKPYFDEEISTDERLNAYKSYQWRQEIISLVARILITIAIEMGVALLFGFRGKKPLLFLVIVNTVTQIILNVILNVINFNSGQAAFIAGYIMLELAVFAMEATLYCFLMKKYTEKTKPAGFYVLYAFVANAVSFGAGLAIANILPGIF